ncbi:MAG: flagellar hook assembly protein FlgD [Pseudobdellovibrionaceae bacterium]
MAVTTVSKGVKAFRDGPSDAITKPSQENNLSAQDLAKLGGENVGDILNKIADPNYVDPSRKMRTTGNPNLDKDAFMKLMLAQMKHQDPTNPLKSHEMAAQMAQFTSVEQMMNINKTLEGMRADQKPLESFQALNFIGKAVSGDSAKLVRIKGDTNHDFSFSLPEDAAEAEVRVRNENGDVVRKVDLKNLKAGENRWSWNGLDERGMAMPGGEYKFFIEAKNPAGRKLAVKTDFDGTITGVNYTAEGPVLLIGNQSVKLKDVKKIVDPRLMRNDQNVNSVQPQDLKSQQSAAQNGEEVQKAGDPEPNAQNSLMDTVGLSREMMTKLQKELK